MNSNTGRSSSAAAANASFRGTFGFIAVEIAVPLQASLSYTCVTLSLRQGLGHYWRWRVVYDLGWADAFR